VAGEIERSELKVALSPFRFLLLSRLQRTGNPCCYLLVIITGVQ
jgi:hypothetical protein